LYKTGIFHLIIIGHDYCALLTILQIFKWYDKVTSILAGDNFLKTTVDNYLPGKYSLCF